MLRIVPLFNKNSTTDKSSMALIPCCTASRFSCSTASFTSRALPDSPTCAFNLRLCLSANLYKPVN